MYWKDQIRKITNRFLKIDNAYLLRSHILDNYPYFYDASRSRYEIEIQNLSLEVRNLTSDFDVFYQVFVLEEYLYALELFEAVFQRNPDCILDVGANVGYTSVYMNRKHPDTRLIALEPETSNYEQLLRNTADLPNFTPLKKGLWSKTGSMKINNNFRDERAWSFHLDETGGFEEVDVVTLASLLNDMDMPYLDILKMDIEGAEKEVLLNDRKISEVLRKVGLICLEIHDDAVSRKEVIDLLRDVGFSMYGRGETVIGVRER